MLGSWSERVGKRSVSTRVLNLRLSFVKYIHGNLITRAQEDVCLNSVMAFDDFPSAEPNFLTLQPPRELGRYRLRTPDCFEVD